MYLWVYNANFLALTKEMADTFHQYLDPEHTVELPPEMVKRNLGHDFGFADYKN